MDATTAVSSQSFRDAMARIPAAVHVVATDGPAGRGGLTASAVCSVSDAPSTLLVCLHHTSRTNARIKTNGVFTVNALRRDQSSLSEGFAGRRGLSLDERFAEAEWDTLATGAPVLVGSLVSFDCRVASITEVHTHSVVVATVVAVRISDGGEGLVYIDRHYGTARPL